MSFLGPHRLVMFTVLVLQTISETQEIKCSLRRAQEEKYRMSRWCLEDLAVALP